MTRSPFGRALAGLLALAACAHVTPADAAGATREVDISRITLQLPGEGWTVSDKLAFGAAVNSSGLTLDGERRIMTVGQAGSRDGLVMLVSAIRGSRGVSMHAECDPHDGAYVRKFNRGQSNYIPLQCLRMQGPARMPTDATEIDDDFGAAVNAQHVALPPGGYVLSIIVSNDNGASVEITAVLGADLEGMAGQAPAARVPAQMPPAIAAWADRLGEEALGTLSSWSGRMTVPPVVFKPPAAREPTLKTALAAPAASKD
jgi:hypothetical protein